MQIHGKLLEPTAWYPQDNMTVSDTGGEIFLRKRFQVVVFSSIGQTITLPRVI